MKKDIFFEPLFGPGWPPLSALRRYGLARTGKHWFATGGKGSGGLSLELAITPSLVSAPLVLAAIWALVWAFPAIAAEGEGSFAVDGGRSTVIAVAALPPPDRTLSRIAFGSCLHQGKPQPIWQAIKAVSPELMVMAGDAVYGSTNEATIAPLEQAYAAQAANPEFQAARAVLPMLAIWDDHDFGRNDAGGDYPLKGDAARLFEAFWGAVPERPAPFEKSSGGLYQVRTFGASGSRVQVILLDTRWFRSPLKPKKANFPHWGRYEPDTDAASSGASEKTLLGETQWRWLEAVLSEPADLRILVSSIQVLAEGHGFERWGNLPAERARLLGLLGGAAGRTVIVSGDRHYGAFYEARSGSLPNLGSGSRLVEMTASALNVASGGPAQDTQMAPLVSNIIGADNFGLAEIDWPARTVTLSLRTLDGSVAASHVVAF